MSSMDGMSSMEGMGMDMGSDGMFRPVNQTIARTYWYLVAAFFASALLLKGVGAIESWSRLVPYPTLPAAISGPSAIAMRNKLICSFQVNDHPARFPSLTQRDLGTLHPKRMRRHSQFSERYPILKWSVSIGQAWRG